MKFRERVPLIISIAVLAMAVVQIVHPFESRVPPGVLIVVGLLFALRYAMRMQKYSRGKILKDVPRRPLGINDDSD